MENRYTFDDQVKILEWVDKFLQENETFRVLPDIKPWDLVKSLEKQAPDAGKALSEVFKEFQKEILPGITHWNHPGFSAYFNSTSSTPAVMAEMLSAAINTNVMLWKASPAGAELEQVTLDWLQKMLGLEGFTGIIYDGGSSSSFHGLAAMREKKLGPDFRKSGFLAFSSLKSRIYLTEQTHNSIHKAIIALGFGADAIVQIKVADDFTMDSDHLMQTIDKDLQKGLSPLCVIATLGTTSCTAIDPVESISRICSVRDLWLHIDAAHGGSAAILETVRQRYKGWENADSITVNPHKWLYIPIDLSVLYIKRPEILKNAFHFSAEYLKTGADGRIENYMDYGIPLGRRFRALKLWFSLKCFGVDFFKEKIAEHMRLAGKFYDVIDASPDFEIMAPMPLSTVCYRALPEKKTDIDAFNEDLMDAVNETGRFFISHTKLNNTFVLRHVISGYRTGEQHVDRFIELIFRLKTQLDIQI